MHKHGGDIYTHADVLDFSANINFRGMPASVRRAAIEAVDSCRNYPDPECRKLRAAIAVREQETKGADKMQITADHVICGNGAADLIFALVRAVKPRQALLSAPTFYEYEQALRSVECKIHRYGLREERGFQLQEDLTEQITPETDLVFVCNPNNPTGVVTQRELLEKILRRCEACDALLVVDECFQDFLADSGAYTMKKYLQDSSHLFILKAFTKMYAMAGLRLGYGLCSNRKLLEEMNRNRQPWSVSIPAQMAGIAAAGEVEFAAESRKLIDQERDFLKQGLAEAGYHFLGSQANYIFFRGPEDLYEKCLQQGILIRDCSNYEGLKKGWYRVAVKNHEDNLQLLRVLTACRGNGKDV